MAEGYVLKCALDENNEICGYQFVKLGKMLEDIRHGADPQPPTTTISVLTAVLTVLLSISIPVKTN